MKYLATADTDIGITKKTNQDSLLIKHGSYEDGEILLAVVCDGMGGLAKGEVASASVITAFSNWFDNELPFELNNPDMKIIGAKWELLLKELNTRISEYGSAIRENMGTTFTGILFVNDEYVVGHVGDSRLYRIDQDIHQLTQDHTYVAREINAGRMTLDQARIDPQRNMLLQCVGASGKVEPQIFWGKDTPGVYMLCSDGFRHEITAREIYDAFIPQSLTDKNVMHSRARYMIDLVKKRNEKDNISVILIRVI